MSCPPGRTYNRFTMSDNDDTGHYEGALLEDVNHKFDVILEYLRPLARLPHDVDELKDDMTVVKTDIRTIKHTIKGQSKDHRQLEKRVTKLEQTA